jgi:hypothetical protein
MENETTVEPADRPEDPEEDTLQSSSDVDMLVRVRDLLSEMP